MQSVFIPFTPLFLRPQRAGSAARPRLGTLTNLATLPELPLFTGNNRGQLDQNQLGTATAASVSGMVEASPHPRGAGLLTEELRPCYDPIAVLPPKLVKRIIALKLVEMAELLPDAWPDENLLPGEDPTQCRTHRPPVTDIQMWLECFARL